MTAAAGTLRPLLLAAIAVVALLLWPQRQAVAAPGSAGAVAVTVEQRALATEVGRRFEFRAVLRNTSGSATGPLLAHLNVASVANDVYVDPEDWSTERSTTVPTMAPGSSRTLTWQLQAVSAGTFAVYAVVVPSEPAGALVASPQLRLTVAERHTLNAGGSLPVVITVPAVLGLASVTVRTRRRARRLAR